MAMKVRLEGHQSDLSALAELFNSPDAQVDHDGEGYYLTSRKLDGATGDHRRLQEAASALLVQVNGIARVHDANFRPVSISSYSVGNTKIITAQLGVAVERVQVRALGVVVGGVSQSSPLPSVAAYLALADSSTDVIEALGLMGGPGAAMSWGDLWKILEIVKHNLGGGTSSIVAHGWATSHELATFSESANRSEISGRSARHARMGGKPSGRSMSLNEGRQLMTRVAMSWLDWLVANQSHRPGP